jgi:nucleoside-diphosphate-sugar epimerase
MNKILITGAAGFIGRKLSDHFMNLKIPTLDVDDLSVEPVVKPKKKLHKIKVQDITHDFLKRNKINKIIHLAAKKSVDQSFTNLSNSIENYEMTIKLLNEANKTNIKRIFLASTCEIFGYQKKKLSENDNYMPHSPYAVTKVANEYLANIYMMQKKNLKITSLIFFNTFGPTEGRDAVIPKFINKLNQGNKIFVEGDGNQGRDFTYIDDTIRALEKILLSNKYFRSINIGSGKVISIKYLIKILKKYYPNLKIGKLPERINEIKNFKANTDILLKKLKLKFNYSFENGIEETIKYFK